MDNERPEHVQDISILDYDVFDLADRVLDDYPEPIPFEDFGPYRVHKEPIGRGGMGEVFLAEDEIAGRQVAIKFLCNVWSSPDLRHRFTREIKTLAKLEHPFIARLYDAGVHPNGTPYFVMEYVEGKPLDQYCREQGCSLPERIRLFRSICEAVQYAHSRLIVHRDLKPSNILVKKDGTPKLLDFGIAKQLENLDQPARQTQTELRFTRAFAAPEQIRGEPVGVYTDVYALGVILYELLAGRPPYDLEKCTPGQAEALITGGPEPEKPSVVVNRNSEQASRVSKAAWNDLDVLCLQAMKRDVGRRYHSVVELTQDIDRYLKGEPLKARPDTLGYRLGKFISRNRQAIFATMLAFTLVAGLITFFTLRLARERDHANRETAIATAMNRFLSDDLLGRSNPFKSEKSKESFVDAVTQASPGIDSQFKTEPIIAARLHQTLARAFDNRSDFPQAREEYTKANTLFQQGEGPLSQDAVIVRLQRASMEARSYGRGSLPLAKSLLRDAEMSISKIAQPRGDVAVWDLSARGSIAMIENDVQSAHKYFSDALRRSEAVSSLDEIARTRIKVLLAASDIHLADGAQAEPLLREAIETFSKAYGAASPEALRVRAYLAQALMVQRKYAEAVQEANAIYPALVEKLGEDHETTMAILGTRAASEGYLGMWDETIRDDLAIYRDAVRKHGPVSLFSIANLSDAALAQCRAGRYAEGESNARKAFQESKQAFGARAGLTGGCAYALAICSIGTNKLKESSELLENIDVQAVTQLSGDPTVGASIALAQGEIAARQGDYSLAQHYAESAAPAFERPDAEAVQKQELAKLRKMIEPHLIKH